MHTRITFFLILLFCPNHVLAIHPDQAWSQALLGVYSFGGNEGLSQHHYHDDTQSLPQLWDDVYSLFVGLYCVYCALDSYHRWKVTRIINRGRRVTHEELEQGFDIGWGLSVTSSQVVRSGLGARMQHLARKSLHLRRAIPNILYRGPTNNRYFFLPWFTGWDEINANGILSPRLGHRLDSVAYVTKVDVRNHVKGGRCRACPIIPTTANFTAAKFFNKNFILLIDPRKKHCQAFYCADSFVFGGVYFHEQEWGFLNRIPGSFIIGALMRYPSSNNWVYSENPLYKSRRIKREKMPYDFVR